MTIQLLSELHGMISEVFLDFGVDPSQIAMIQNIFFTLTCRATAEPFKGVAPHPRATNIFQTQWFQQIPYNSSSWTISRRIVKKIREL